MTLQKIKKLRFKRDSDVYLYFKENLKLSFYQF